MDVLMIIGTYYIQCLRSPLADKGSRNGGDALRSADMALRAVDQHIVRYRHVQIYKYGMGMMSEGDYGGNLG